MRTRRSTSPWIVASGEDFKQGLWFRARHTFIQAPTAECVYVSSHGSQRRKDPERGSLTVSSLSQSQRRKVRDMPVEFVESHKLLTSGNETKTLNKRCAFFPNNKKAAKQRASCTSFRFLICLLVYHDFDTSACTVRMGIVSRTCWKGVHHRHVEECHQKEPNSWRALPLETLLCWGVGHVSGPSAPQRRFFGELFFCE